MRRLLGLLLIIASILLGLYVGIYMMVIGGIFAIINFIKGGLNYLELYAWGILKIMFCSIIGTIDFYVLLVPGLVCSLPKERK